MEKVVAIVGPTAVGKSALGLKLSKQFDGEIISGDSMQIYKDLDIGTAKDSPSELLEVPHHLVDISAVTERYTVKDFQTQAQLAISDISKRNKNSFIVGGTGFYLNSLINNLDLGGNDDSSKELRDELANIENTVGISGLQKRLKETDPIAYSQIDIENPRRVTRAIEVYINTGHSITAQENGTAIADFYLIGLTDDRQVLYDRINKRVDQMIDKGLLDEAKQVFIERDKIPQAKNGIGYKELFPYFQGQSLLETCVEEIKKNSRHFAKRQLTYFRNQMDVDWHNITEEPDYTKNIQSKVAQFLR